MQNTLKMCQFPTMFLLLHDFSIRMMIGISVSLNEVRREFKQRFFNASKLQLKSILDENILYTTYNATNAVNKYINNCLVNVLQATERHNKDF